MPVKIKELAFVFHTTADVAKARAFYGGFLGLKLPLVVRLEGNNVAAGKATLAASGLTIVSGDSMADAAQKIVKLVA